MGKITNFFGKWFDETFWGALVSFIGVAAVSVGLQYFLFWAGNSIQGVEYLGYYLDTGLLVLLMIVASPGLDSSILFPYKGTSKLGTICVSAVCCGVLGAYVYLVYDNSLALILISLVLMLWGLVVLEGLKADTNPLLIYVGVGLIYALGAHYAMQFNGMGSSIDIAILIILLVMALVSFFKPAFD